MRLDEARPAAAWSVRLDELRGPRAGAHGAAVHGAPLPRPRDRARGRPDRGLALDGGPRAHRREGQTHVANMPTEEVFTSPHRLRADGTVRATMPLRPARRDRRGARAAARRRRDRRGEATRGEDLVRSEIALDDGARRLGELALVDASSRVGDTGIVFRNTLFDENAASHIAWGAGLAWTVDGIARRGARGRRAQRIPDAHRLHDRLARGRGRRGRAGRRHGAAAARRRLAALGEPQPGSASPPAARSAGSAAPLLRHQRAQLGPWSAGAITLKPRRWLGAFTTRRGRS